MTKNVSVPLVCALASMAGTRHPIPIAIVDRLRIAFNICYSLEGREFARKEDPSVVYEGCSWTGRSVRSYWRGQEEKGYRLAPECRNVNGAVFPVYRFARQACSYVLLTRSKITCIDDPSQIHELVLFHIATRASGSQHSL